MNETESTFQLPPELNDVPLNYSMTHITFEDVQGILSLVDIALARGSIKGDELTVLNQIRNDCLAELQDFQVWQQKRQQVMAVEAQVAREERETSEAKIQSAQEAARILQNRINELEGQITARGITPVAGTEVPTMPNTNVSKAFENARKNNPVPTITNQPQISEDEEFNAKVSEAREAFDSNNSTIDDQMKALGDMIDFSEDEEWTYSFDDADFKPLPTSDGKSKDMDNVAPLFEIKVGQDGNVPLGEQVTEEDVNANVTEMEMDDFEPIEGDGEVEIEVREDPESIAEVQKMKESVEDEYEEIVIPNSMELQKMTKSRIAEVGTSLGFVISQDQTKSAMIKDFEESSWNLIQEAEADENSMVHQDEDIIRDGGYFGEDDS
jgi:hypothetical protein